MARSLLAMNFGVLNHTAFTSAARYIPGIARVQSAISLMSFIVIDIIVLFLADYVHKHFDSEIEKLLNANNNDKSQEDGMADVFGKMNGMMNMFDSFTGNPMIKMVIKYYGFVKKIQELIQDIFIFFFGIFLMDSVVQIAKIAGYPDV